MLKIHPRSIFPDPSDYRTRRGWISHVMDEILKGMRNGDRACAWIAIELVEEDAGFAFGSLMKANAARELKRFDLDETQKQCIRERVLDMLQRQFMPHEFKHYIRLVLRIGTGPYCSEYEALRLSPHRWVRWFAAIALGENPGRKPESYWHLRRYGAGD